MRILIISLALLVHMAACAQTTRSTTITPSEAARIEGVLASDSLQGRLAGSDGSEKAARFIAAEFKKAGLQPLAGDSYLQSFGMLQPKDTRVTGTADGVVLNPDGLIVVSVQPSLSLTEASGYKTEHVRPGENIFTRISAIMRTAENTLVFLDSSYARQFPRLAGFQRPLAG